MPERKTYISANELLSDSWRLAAAVRRGEWRPDWIVALWRGGTPAGVAVHEFLKVSGWNVRHVPLKCSSYTGIEEHGGVAFTLGDETFSMFAPGEKVLFVDDVFDTGGTALAVKKKADAAGIDMRFAAVYWKPDKNTTCMTPDYHVRKFSGEWIVFPHELEGLSPAELSEKDSGLKSLLEEFSR